MLGSMVPLKDELLSRLAAEANVAQFISFRAGAAKGGPFSYGLTRRDDVLAVLRARAGEGLHTIANETVDVGDGGVSGVALGGRPPACGSSSASTRWSPDSAAPTPVLAQEGVPARRAAIPAGLAGSDAGRDAGI